MARRYTYRTCLSFGTDGESDYCEIDVAVSFTVAWGSPESGTGYMADPYKYDPGSAPIVEDVRVEQIDTRVPTAGDRLTVEAILAEMEANHEDDLLEEAQDYEASHHDQMEWCRAQERAEAA